METQPVVAVFHENTGILEIEIEREDDRYRLELQLTKFQMWEMAGRLIRRLRYLASE